MLDQFGNHLGISVGLKLVSLALQKQLDILVIGDDAVVNDHKLIPIVRTLRMGVDFGRNAVGCPTSVRNSNMDVMNFSKGEMFPLPFDGVI